MRVTYHKTHKHKDNLGRNHVFTTELTKEGVKCFSDGEEQGIFQPHELQTFVESLEWCVKQKIIQSFTLEDEVTVTDRNGYWEETTEDE